MSIPSSTVHLNEEWAITAQHFNKDTAINIVDKANNRSYPYDVYAGELIYLWPLHDETIDIVRELDESVAGRLVVSDLLAIGSGVGRPSTKYGRELQHLHHPRLEPDTEDEEIVVGLLK